MQLQASHLKMAQVPQGCSDLVPQHDASGHTLPFPLLVVQNVIVLPGVPSLVQAKWPGVQRRLQEQFGAPESGYHNRCVRAGAGVCPRNEAVNLVHVPVHLHDASVHAASSAATQHSLPTPPGSRCEASSQLL